MSAYNAVNGEWCGQHRGLLTGVLRERWGFEGFVLTDFIFGIRDAERGALAGQDLEMPFRFVYRAKLRSLVRDGRVPEQVVDSAVMRILRQLLAVPEGGLSREPARLRGAHRAGPRGVEAVDRAAEERGRPTAEARGLPGADRGAERHPETWVIAARPTAARSTASHLTMGCAPGWGERLQWDNGRDPRRAASVAAECDAALVVVGYTHEQEGEYIVPNTPRGFIGRVPLPGWVERALERPRLRDLWTRAGDKLGEVATRPRADGDERGRRHLRGGWATDPRCGCARATWR